MTVACATCTNPSAEYTVVSDCLNAPNFVDVDITSMGDASSLTISDNYGNSSNLDNVGSIQFGLIQMQLTYKFCINDQMLIVLFKVRVLVKEYAP